MIKVMINEYEETESFYKRVEAMKRFGVKTYPTVFYFKDQLARDTFLKSLE